MSYEFKIFPQGENVEEKLAIARFLSKDDEYKKWNPDGNNPAGVGNWEEHLIDKRSPLATWFALYDGSKLIACSRCVMPTVDDSTMQAHEVLEYKNFKALNLPISQAQASDYIEANRCCVHPEYQRKGLVNVLLLEMIKYLHAQNIQKNLFTTTRFKPVKDLLGRAQFSTDEKWRFKYSDEDAEAEACQLYTLGHENFAKAIEALEKFIAKQSSSKESSAAMLFKKSKLDCKVPDKSFIVSRPRHQR